MSKPDLLMTGPLRSIVPDQLQERFTLHQLHLAEDREAMLKSIADSVVAIATSAFHEPVNAAMIERLPKLKIIGNFGVGYDTVDASYAARRQVYVTNTPDVLTEEVADTAIGLMIMTVRELGAAERHLRAGNWLNEAYRLTPGTLSGRTLGIYGLGRIGRAIARRAEAHGMAIRYHARNRVPGAPYPYHASLRALADAVDTLMVVVPGTPETQHAVNMEVLEALGPSGVLINIGRGTTVDELALITALQNGTILSAGLDVFEEEPSVPQALIDMDHVVLLPHVGSASVHTRDAMGQRVVDNLFAWLDNKPLISPVSETPGPYPR
ncbi:MAG: 2-hydroxyacid dehydrogenase [Pseudomonadota bacterium]